MKMLISNEQQLQKMKSSPGFIAALDQSGGSTPKALHAYGIKKDAWSNEDEMFAIVHQMRTRIITSPSFTGERILAAILFENTMDRDIQGQPTADYLWNVKQSRAFSENGQGAGSGKGWGPVDEAHAAARRAARQGPGQTDFRHEDALAHQASERRRHQGDRQSAIRIG